MHILFSSELARRILGALCAALIVLLVVIQVNQFNADRQLRARADQSYAAETLLYRLLSLLQDVETGQRGYVLTGNPDFLEPYARGQQETAQMLADIETHLGDRAREDVRALEALIREKLRFAQSVVERRQRGDVQGATALVAKGHGKAVMDGIRARVSGLVGDERQQVERLRAGAEKSRERLQVFSGTLQLILLSLLLLAYFANVRNVRRLKTATQEATDQSTRQMAIFESSMDAMLVLDAEGCIETWNSAAQELFQRRPDALVGTSVATLFASVRKDSTIKALLKRLAKGQKRWRAPATLTGLRHDGSMFDADVVTSTVDLIDGRRYLVTIRDATERRRVERLKSEFVSTVSHELRTPLTSIAGSLGLVSAGAAGSLEPRLAKLIAIAHSNSQRLVRLINDLLDIEKIESGNMAFNLRPLSVREVVEETVQANSGFAAERGVEIALEAGDRQLTVQADRDRLIQVITNLLSNAIKFSAPMAAVRVRIDGGEKYHRITVSDCGPGIPESFQANLFDKFSQADSSDTRSKGGTGLGLAIVKEILGRTGGTIDYETSAKGTSFWVDIPAASVPQRRNRVALLHLEEGMAASISDALLVRNIDAISVDSLEDLGASVDQSVPDAIIIPLQQVDEGPSALLKQIRQHPRLAAVPVLAAAPGDDPGEISQTLALVNWLDGAPSAADLATGAALVARNGPGSGTLTVLHIEDDEDVLRVVASAFDKQARVMAARDAQEARAILSRRAPDLVILDLALPGESGLQLLADLRFSDGKPIPVVIYTASDEDPGIASRVAAMLTKSKVELNDLVSTVLKVVREQEVKPS